MMETLGRESDATVRLAVRDVLVRVGETVLRIGDS